MSRRFDWAQYRTTEFEGLDPEGVIAVLPTAAIEQHGPHLPVGTDTMIARGMLRELRNQCPEDLDIRILPIQAIGKSNEHIHAPGTLTLPYETALESWIEIGLSVARAGLRKIVIVNSHGGNLPLIQILGRELRVRAGMMAVTCQWGSFGHPEGMFSAHELAYGIHGGDVETSLMLDFAPECVDMGAAMNFISAAETNPVPPIGAVAQAWVSSDLNAHGTVGNAKAATAAKGQATCTHQVAGMVELLRKMRAQPLNGLDPTQPDL